METLFALTHGGQEIQQNDYLSRRLLGEYLAWAYREFTQELPAGMRIQAVHQHAVNLHPQQNGKTEIITDDGKHYSADFVYITTGHSKNILSLDDHCLQQFISSNQHKNNRLSYYSTPYPTSRLEAISAESQVLVQGIGLTAKVSVDHLSIRGITLAVSTLIINSTQSMTKGKY